MRLKIDDSAALGAAMAAALRTEGLIVSDRVAAAATSTVPRHTSAPGEPLDNVYETHTRDHCRRGGAHIAHHPNTAYTIDLTGWRTTKRLGTLAIGWS
jgi:hypothetical protein